MADKKDSASAKPSLAPTLDASGLVAGVWASVVTSITQLPEVINAVSKLGVSSTVRIRGSNQQLRSSLTRLSSRDNLVSAAVRLRGDSPAE